MIILFAKILEYKASLYLDYKFYIFTYTKENNILQCSKILTSTYRHMSLLLRTPSSA